MNRQVVKVVPAPVPYIYDAKMIKLVDGDTVHLAEGISKLADIALLAIRQQSPAKYGYFIWNQHPLFGPYGSTLQGPLKF